MDRQLFCDFNAISTVTALACPPDWKIPLLIKFIRRDGKFKFKIFTKSYYSYYISVEVMFPFISKIEVSFLWVISFQHFMEGNFKNSITNSILLLVSNVIR